MVRRVVHPHLRQRAHGLRLSLYCSIWATALSIALRGAPGVDAGPHLVPGPAHRPGAVHPVDGAAPRRRRRGAVLRARPAGAGRPVPRPLVRHHSAVHHRRRDRGPDLRGHAVPGDHRRRRPSVRSTSATRRRPAPSAARAGTCSAESRCPPSARASSLAPCWRGPALSASSAPPSPSPATSPAAPRPCRSPSTSPTRTNPDQAIMLSIVLDRGLLRRAGRCCATGSWAAARRRHDARGPPRPHASGTFQLDVELHAEAGEVVALLGPNGAGKSTRLPLPGRPPAPSTTGRIELDGKCLDDPAEDVFVPPERRAVAVVFQDYLLFANLTALENVAFGLRARGVAKATARAQAAGVAGPGRPRRPRRPPAADPLRRPGPAGRPGPGPGHRAAPAAPRRATGRPRRRHPRRGAPRPPPPPRPPSKASACSSPTTPSTPTPWPTGSSSSRAAASSRPARWPRSPPSPGPGTSPISSA